MWHSLIVFAADRQARRGAEGEPMTRTEKSQLDSPPDGGASANLQIFENPEFHLRVIPDGDSFRVEAVGLAKALGFHEARDMVRTLPDGEKGSETAPTLGGEQRVWYVTESGFYRAVGQRQAARIKDVPAREMVARFQSWVYGEVLPSIRRTGSYRPGQAESDPLVNHLARITHEQKVVPAAGSILAHHRWKQTDKGIETLRQLFEQIELFPPASLEIGIGRKSVGGSKPDAAA